MTSVEGPTAFVLFHESNAGGDSPPRNDPPEHSIGYLQARERDERAAAKRASSSAARRAHQELAQHYARKISTQGGLNGS